MSRALLMVLDGFGIGKDSPFNAIQNARMPFYKDLIRKYPFGQLLTHGAAVGLPEGVMGNSEVGHMTMGAGRVLYQDLVRVSNAIRSKEFFSNPTITRVMKSGAETTGRVHLMGLVSDGGVHSHLEHLEACLTLALDLGIPEVSVHAFLDGRDTPPQSAAKYLERLLTHPAFQKNATLTSITGRYYAMDRDQRWDRIELALACLTGAAAASKTQNAITALEQAYAAGENDEFVKPILLWPDRIMQDGDSVFFFNYRSDRARQLSRRLTEGPQTPESKLPTPKLSSFGGMTVYDAKLAIPAAFPQQSLANIFPELLERAGKTQFRIAETEKYAHVTFFFNGGRELVYRGEERLMIASPKDVATYDQRPEMSSVEVAAQAKLRIETAPPDFMLMNFANADMVGHTGNYVATVQAMEALDRAIGTVVGAAERAGYHTILTADHGNAEEMCDDEGRPHTQHTLNPVPVVWIPPNSADAPRSHRPKLRDGTLADLMPTLCEIFQLPNPPEVTGRSLIAPGELS